MFVWNVKVIIQILSWNRAISSHFDEFFKVLIWKFALDFQKAILPQINSPVSWQSEQNEKCWMKRQQRATISYSAHETKTSFCLKTNFSNIYFNFPRIREGGGL